MVPMSKIITPPYRAPRISVPVDGETLAIFERLAKAGNMSTGRAMAEWLRDTVEAAELMAATMERARAAPKVVTAELHAMMLGMADQTKELQNRFAKFKGSMDSQSKNSAPGEAKARTSDESFGQFADKLIKNTITPPSCNTGGKVTEANKRKNTKGPK